MSLAAQKEQGQAQANPFAGKKNFTYNDYLNWPDDVRAEIIDGIAYMMGQPSTSHQRVSGKLFAKLFNFLEGKTCEPFAAPFGVRLFPKEDKTDDTVVEPEIAPVSVLTGLEIDVNDVF